MRGEKKARWFISHWRGLGGGFVFATDAGKEVMALRMPPDRPISEEVAMFAMFSFAHSYTYRVAAKIVRAEGLNEPESQSPMVLP